MAMMMNEKIIIVKDEYDGEKLKAIVDINEGELIFQDKPFAWTFRHDYKLDRTYCYTCGNTCSNVSINNIRCDDDCPEIFCSSTCVNDSQNDGHQWMCCKNIDAMMLSELYELDKKGHVIIALKVYCKIAQIYLNNDTANDPINIANDLLNGYLSADYCQTQHAARGGLSIFDSNLFNDLIAPAYFDSNLAIPLERIKIIFDSNKLWKSIDHDRKVVFLQSEIFSETFFRSLVGTMVINNLQVKVQGPMSDSYLSGSGLYPIYSKMNHSCHYNIRNEINEGNTEVSVYAARNIKKGEDILTTYLHDDPTKLRKSERKRQLAQYLFACSCMMCNEQETDDDDDDDDNEGDNEDDN